MTHFYLPLIGYMWTIYNMVCNIVQSCQTGKFMLMNRFAQTGNKKSCVIINAMKKLWIKHEVKMVCL